MIVSESFVIADWTDPGTHPGRPIAGLHVHRSDDEAWIVLEGQLGFRVGDEETHGARRRVAARAARDAPLLLEPHVRAGALPARDDPAHPPPDRGPALGPARRFRSDLRGARLRAAGLRGRASRAYTLARHDACAPTISSSTSRNGPCPATSCSLAASSSNQAARSTSGKRCTSP